MRLLWLLSRSYLMYVYVIFQYFFELALMVQHRKRTLGVCIIEKNNIDERLRIDSSPSPGPPKVLQDFDRVMNKRLIGI